MHKRGQITLYIIVGLTIILAIGLMAFFGSKDREPPVNSGEINLDSPVKGYVETCLEKETLQGITYFGLGVFSASQIEDYLNHNFDQCIQYDQISSQGFEVTRGQVISHVEITDRAVNVVMQYPLLVSGKGQKQEYKEFKYTLSRVAPLGERMALSGFVTKIDRDKELSSTNKKATLKVPSGTTVEGDGELKIEERNFDSKTNQVSVGNVLYTINGVKFSPYAELTIKYEDADVPKGYNVDMLAVARYNKEKDIWNSVASTTDKNLKSVTGKIILDGQYGIVWGCKTTNSVSQVNYTDWLYREQVYSGDKTLINPNFATKETGIAALPFLTIESRPKRHEQLAWSGAAGTRDKSARPQIGTPKAKPVIKDWDEDDKTENEAACPQCTKDQAACKPLCQAEAIKQYRDEVWVVDGSEPYLSKRTDGIKDGTTPECDTKDCYCPDKGPCEKCPKSCKPETVKLATPNNYGYENVGDVGGSGKFEYRMLTDGNSCVGPEDYLKIDFKTICNDQCTGKLNDKDVNVDNRPIKDALLAGGQNNLTLTIINTADAASYARGYFDLLTGTGSYKKCDLNSELKTNCMCGTSNVNLLEDKKEEKGDYGEWELKVTSKKFCCADGTVVDDYSKCVKTNCPTDKPIEQSNTGCMCAEKAYDYNTDGPGYCCATQTCEGATCTPGAGFASGKTPKDDLDMHEYKLEYKGGQYSIYMDSRLIKTSASSQKPTRIDFGNDLRPSSASGTWTFLKVYPITVTDDKGTVVFTEKFESATLDAAKWTIDAGEGVVNVAGGAAELKLDKADKYTNKFPYVKTKEGLKVFPDGDFTLTFKMQYTQVTGHGVYFGAGPGILSIGQDNSAPGGAPPKYGSWRLRISLLGSQVYACGGTGGCGTKTCEPRIDADPAAAGPTNPANCAHPSKLGVHMMLQEYDVADMGKQLDKAHELVGDCGFAKNMVINVGVDGKEPDILKWSTFVKESNRRKLIPILRLQGSIEGSSWQKPNPAADYTTVAQKYVYALKAIEETAGMKVNYVEIWNEPNLAGEWGGAANPEEYGKFLLAVAKAIRQYDMIDGKKDTNIMNGGLAPTGDNTNGNVETKTFIDRMISAAPELKDYLDLWASHPYPPEQDIYKEEREVLARKGISIPVIITEVGWGRCADSSCTSLNNLQSPESFKQITKNWVDDSNVQGAVIWLFTSKQWKLFNLVDDSLAENDYFKSLKSLGVASAAPASGSAPATPGSPASPSAGTPPEYGSGSLATSIDTIDPRIPRDLKFFATVSGPATAKKMDFIGFKLEYSPDFSKKLRKVSVYLAKADKSAPGSFGCTDAAEGGCYLSGTEYTGPGISGLLTQWTSNERWQPGPGIASGEYIVYVVAEQADFDLKNIYKCTGLEPIPEGYTKCNANKPELQDSYRITITD